MTTDFAGDADFDAFSTKFMQRMSGAGQLPKQVVDRQSAAVDRVTGATYSVQAFQQAVQQALAQAKV